MSDERVLREITEAMGIHSESTPSDRIPQDDVRRWMSSRDLEIQGAVLALLLKPRHYRRINPPMTFQDYHPFVMHHYERCLLENPDGEWSSTRYTAGRSLVNWFKGLWFDSEIPRTAIQELKEWLARLYRQGDEEVRTCIVTATLEHLFEEREIARYFADWKRDPDLGKAFEEAMDWQKPEGAPS